MSCIEKVEDGWVVHDYSDASRKRVVSALRELAQLIESGIRVDRGGVVITTHLPREFSMNIDIAFGMSKK